MQLIDRLSFDTCQLALELTESRLSEAYPDGIVPAGEKDRAFKLQLAYILWAQEHEQD